MDSSDLTFVCCKLHATSLTATDRYVNDQSSLCCGKVCPVLRVGYIGLHVF